LKNGRWLKIPRAKFFVRRKRRKKEKGKGRGGERASIERGVGTNHTIFLSPGRRGEKKREKKKKRSILEYGVRQRGEGKGRRTRTFFIPRGQRGGGMGEKGTVFTSHPIGKVSYRNRGALIGISSWGGGEEEKKKLGRNLITP